MTHQVSDRRASRTDNLERFAGQGLPHGTDASVLHSRGTLAEAALVVASIFVACLAWIIDGSVLLSATLAAYILAACWVTIELHRMGKERAYQGIIVSLLSIYLLVGYAWKSVLARLPLPDEYYRDFRVALGSFQDTLPVAIAYGAGAYLAFYLCFRAVRMPPLKQASRAKNYSPILLLILISLVVKAYTQLLLDWGVPADEPKRAIPLVTGLIVMHSRLGIHYLTTLLFLAVAQRRLTQGQTALTACFAIVNVLLDVAVGVKFSLVYFAVSVLFCLVYSTQGIRRQVSLAKAGVISLLLALVVTGSYQFVQYYRFSRLSNRGQSVASIAAEASKNLEQNTSSNIFVYSGVKILKRINGFQNAAMALRLESRLNPRFVDVVSSSDLTDRFTVLTTGVRNAKNASGITQCGFIAIFTKRNLLGVFTLSFLMNFGVLAGVFTLLAKVVQSDENQVITGLVVGLLLINMQFAGGDLLTYAKQLFAVSLAFIAAEWSMRGRGAFSSPQAVESS